MNKLSRRNFLKLTGAAGAAPLLTLGCATASTNTAGSGKAKVVVIGGGFGGATAARYLKQFGPELDVTLIEGNKTYATCPGSNWVIGGLRDMSSITFDYGNFDKHGVRVINDWVTGVDTGNRTVKLKGGSSVAYDRLIVSPGISFKEAHGWSESIAEHVPHAWKAGPQTAMLRKQLEAMPDGGTFLIVPPPNPFRCPPGPAERISMVAHYFKTHKPRSKIVAVDVKGKFSKQGLFTAGWASEYAGMIDYHKEQEIESIDWKSGTVTTAFETYKGDVLNYIPAQHAGSLAIAMGLADDSGWCPVDHATWESKNVPNVHVIGDAAIQAPLPKSGYAANSEAKVCAAAVASLLAGEAPSTPSWVNTCYSLVAPEYGISVAMVYDLKKGSASKVEGSGGLSPADGDKRLEALYAQSWYNNITAEIFG